MCKYIFYIFKKGEERLMKEQNYSFTAGISGFSAFFSSFPSPLLCHLPTSCPPQAYLSARQSEKQKVLTLYKHFSAIVKTLVCYQQCFSQKS